MNLIIKNNVRDYPILYLSQYYYTHKTIALPSFSLLHSSAVNSLVYIDEFNTCNFKFYIIIYNGIDIVMLLNDMYFAIRSTMTPTT